MKSDREIAEMLAAFDLTGSLRAAGEIVGCDHKTVARYVRRRDAGLAADGGRLTDPYRDKIVELVARSNGRISARQVHRRVSALGFTGSERTIRAAVAAVKSRLAGPAEDLHWTPEPGLWMEFDWIRGPVVAGRPTSLWIAWLSWSRFRVILPSWGRSVAATAHCLDTTLRRFGGVPSHAVIGSDRAVCSGLDAIGRHYGVDIRHHAPAPGAVIAPDDRLLVRPELPAFLRFGELEAWCARLCAEHNGEVGPDRDRSCVELLLAERARLRRLPAHAY
ncbi:MAG TPA: hypothetical protein VGD48_07145 [Kutzneria sp.]|jgi:hypothetical protein